ncbi:MAG TPA: glycosyltransferase family 39 protein [Longimicrobiales bacterium]
MNNRTTFLALSAIVTAFTVSAAAATRHTSTTFDEILLPSAGARGYVTGEFDMVIDHPPLLQYVYGLPVFLSRPSYPAESLADWNHDLRYGYARAFFWQVGNDPERIAFIARFMGVLMGAALIVVTFLLTRSAAGPAAGLIAALLVASLPDVLAHSGISYNDVPLALVLLVTAWAIDRTVRRPTIARAAVAGLATGIAFGVKFSAIVLGPMTLLLLLCEAVTRWPDRGWLRRTLLLIPVFTVAAYLALVAVYLGDFTLREFWVGLDINIRHANTGHGAPAVLLGRYSLEGWWYFFPVAFFLKTSVALHALLLVALAGALAAVRHGRQSAPHAAAAPSTRALLERALASPLRVPAVGGAVFLAFVIAADLNIGFRHALPILPFACILIAAGVRRAWSLRLPLLRAVVVAALAWHVIAPLRFYPFYISFLSEYTGPVEYSYETLVDSSLDWGQGLLELRNFMRQENVPRIMLSYFGSALPEGYGIDYVAMPSFFPLPAYGVAEGDTLPRWVAISATNLAGNYLRGDPFARFRDIRPTAVVGRSIFLFHLEGD